MRNFRNILLFAVMVCAAIAPSGCGWLSHGGVKAPPLTETTANPTETGGKIIPPTPVTGSYLVAEIRGDDGEPIANAKVSLLGSANGTTSAATSVAFNLWLESLNAAVLYETVSNAEGQIAVPIRFIFSDVLELKITKDDFTLSARVKIPTTGGRRAIAITQLSRNAFQLRIRFACIRAAAR
jgi:hypothetical protein